MAKTVAWSFSALELFETCPRQYYEVKIRKSVKQENYAASEGAKKHGEIEHYLKTNTPPTYPDIKASIRVIDHFKNMPGEIYTEYKMALDTQLQPVNYFDWGNVWLRAVTDLLVVQGDTAIQVDWKFGKPRDGDDQLKLCSAAVFAHFPEVKQVKGLYVYFANKMSSPTYVYNRADVEQTWADFGRRYSSLLKAANSLDVNVWVPKPSGLCRKYCGVVTCEFNGGYVGGK